MSKSKNKDTTLLEDLDEALIEIKKLKSGKITLHGTSISPKPILAANSKMIKDIRERLHLSQALFAMKLRVPEST